MTFDNQGAKLGVWKRRCNRFGCVTMKDVFKCLSALILPLLLGVVTVVITIQQQHMARDQWQADRHEMRQQRLDDRNESQQQRQQELHIANQQREEQKEDFIQRNREDNFVSYIRDIGELLEKTQGSLTSNPIVAAVARVKTLNTVRRLDGSRNTLLIRFLYEARQLTKTTESAALDISTANLINIEKDALEAQDDIGSLSLVGTTLKNCTFDSTTIAEVDFSKATLKDVNFSASKLGQVTFIWGCLYHVDFSSSELYDVKFSSATLSNISFALAKLNITKFPSAFLHYVNFTSTKFGKMDYSVITSNENYFALSSS